MITTKGEKFLKAKFKKLAKQIKSNKTPMFKRIGIEVLNEVSKNFQTESNDGKRWQGLSSDTKKQRREGPGSGNPRILQNTGTLRRSFVFDANNNRVKVGTSIEYAPLHEFGNGVPQRKMLPTNKRALEISIEVADKYIDEKIKQADL